MFIADTRRIVPPFACRSRRHGAPMAYARETPAEVLDKVGEGYALDATRDRHGARRTARRQHRPARRALDLDGRVRSPTGSRCSKSLTPQKSRAINRQAFEAGRAWAEAARSRPVAAVRRRLRRARRRRRPAGRVGQARNQRRVVQGLRHLRETLPGTLPRAQRPAGRVAQGRRRPAPAAASANGSAPTSRSKSARSCMNAATA